MRVESNFRVEVGELADEQLVSLRLVQRRTGLVVAAWDDGVAPCLRFEKEPPSLGWKLQHRIRVNDSLDGALRLGTLSTEGAPNQREST